MAKDAKEILIASVARLSLKQCSNRTGDSVSGRNSTDLGYHAAIHWPDVVAAFLPAFRCRLGCLVSVSVGSSRLLVTSHDAVSLTLPACQYAKQRRLLRNGRRLGLLQSRAQRAVTQDCDSHAVSPVNLIRLHLRVSSR